MLYGERIAVQKTLNLKLSTLDPISYFWGMRKKNVVLQQVTVEDYAAEGKALGRTEGKVVFISGAVPGDVVDVQLSKNKKDWAEGKAIGFHSYSKDRVQPF